MSTARKQPAKKAAAKKKVAKTAAAPKRVQTVKNAAYSVRLKVMGKFYESQGESLTEALSGLQASRNVRGVGVLVVSNGTRTIERIIQAAVVARLFSFSPAMRQAQLKNLAFLFRI